MKIAFFADAFPDIAVTFIINQVTGMMARGHDVDIYAQYPGMTKIQHPDSLRWDLEKRTQYIGPPEQRVERLLLLARSLVAHPRRFPLLLRTIPPFERGIESRSLRHFAAAEYFLERPRHYDVIHCHFGPNGVTAVILRKLGFISGPILTTFHGYDMRRGQASAGRCYAALRAAGDRFLSISDYNRSLLMEWGFPAERILHHPVGVDPERFQYRGPRSGPLAPIRLLTVANLVPVKGHMILLEAIRSLSQSHTDLSIELRVIGEGPQRNELENFIAENDLTSMVSLLGAMSQSQVISELESSDVFVLPSLAEATPVALMEAQCVGLPIVATRVGAVGEVVVDGSSGILVEPGDVQGLADALLSMLTSRNSWPRMGELGRAHVVTNYGIQRLQDELENIYLEVSSDHWSRRAS